MVNPVLGIISSPIFEWQQNLFRHGSVPARFESSSTMGALDDLYNHRALHILQIFEPDTFPGDVFLEQIPKLPG